MGEVVVDSSVLLGFLDPRDAHNDAAKRVIAAAVTNGDSVVLPASVLAEVLVGAARSGTGARNEVERRLLATVRAAHPTVRLPDALVVATGRVVDGRVLTADKGWPAVDGRVEVVGP
jgi:predicted nucleic acid-binding protein